MTRSKRNKKLHKKTEKTNNKKTQPTSQVRSKKKRNKKPFIFIFLFFVIILIGLTGYINTRVIIVHEHPVRLTNLPAENHGFKIVHFSDLHYGSSFRGQDINTLVNKINRSKPDLIVFTGDLVRDTVSTTEEQLLIAGLKELDPTIGTFAVLGETDDERAKYIFEQTDITLLNNRLEDIYSNSPKPIFLFGLTYAEPNFDELVAEKEQIKDHVVIVLTHNPDNVKNIPNEINVDLVLAGHSHNGQINIPFIDLWNRIDKNIIYSGPHHQVGSTRLFTSSGIGTKYLPFRFGPNSSFNLYRLLQVN